MSKVRGPSAIKQIQHHYSVNSTFCERISLLFLFYLVFKFSEVGLSVLLYSWCSSFGFLTVNEQQIFRAAEPSYFMNSVQGAGRPSTLNRQQIGYFGFNSTLLLCFEINSLWKSSTLRMLTNLFTQFDIYIDLFVNSVYICFSCCFLPLFVSALLRVGR